MSDPAASTQTQPRKRGALHVWMPFVVVLLFAGGLAAFYAYRRGQANPAAPAPRDLAAEARAELERQHFQPLSAPLAALLADTKFEPIPTQTHTLLLQPAPEFALADVEGKEWSLAKALKGGPVVLVFYYGYYCNHCVSQLFALDKDIEKFRELGATVVAVSADPAETTRERYKQYGPFKFPVLSDPGNKLAEKYGVCIPSREPEKEGDLMHGTFIINRQGKITWTNRGDEPFAENRTLLHEAARAEGLLLGGAKDKH